MERPNGDFAHTMVRQFFFSAYALPLWQALCDSSDEALAAIAAKSEKEARYHIRHAGDWFVRLGDGTAESKSRMTAAVAALWPYTGELFEADDVTAQLVETGVAADPAALEGPWRTAVARAFELAELDMPQPRPMQTGGRTGRHTEHLAPLLAELQSVARAYPGARW